MSGSDPDAWMWERAQELLERADRLHRQSFQLGSPRPGGPTWEPPVDVFESEREVRVRVALPGVRLSQVEVLFEERELVVRGECRAPGGGMGDHVHRLEIPQGRFERQVMLPADCVELVSQALEDGCLTLIWRKAGGAR